MNKYNYQIENFFALSSQVVLIQLKKEINPANLQRILHIKKVVNKLFPEAYVYNTYAEISVRFPYFEDVAEKIKLLKSAFSADQPEASLKQPTAKTLEVPVCYSEELAPDLRSYLQAKNMDLNTFIDLHTIPKYLIYFVGFLPGFLYLGGLHQKLYLPRKSTPAPKIDAGSVGIGHQQTGIYPQDSPGGWHIVGKTPIALFDVNQTPASPFQAGDKLQFKSISLKAYMSYV